MDIINNLITAINNSLDRIKPLIASIKEKTLGKNLERITVTYLGQETNQIPKYSQSFHYFGYSYKYGIVRVSCNKPPDYKIGDRLSGIFHSKQYYLFPGTIYNLD